MESNNISKVDLDELRKNNTPKSQIVNSNKIDNSMSNKSNVYSDNYDWSKNSTIEKNNKTVDNYKISYVDFSKIYTNKYDALDGNNPVKISDSTKQLWLNGEATFKTNPDGSVLISVNGVPYGWTTASILNANMESDLKETQNKNNNNNNNQNTSNSETKTEKITVDDLLNTPPAQQNTNTNVNDNSNQTVNENPTVKKNIGATVATLGAGIAEGAADTAEKGLHGLAAMGAAIATPFTGAFDIATGKHATKGMWDQVGDLMMENKVKDSWDSVYNKEISDVKDKTYGFNATRAVGNFGGGMIVGAALSGGLSAAASAPSTTASAGTEVAVSGPTAVAETSQAASTGTEVAVSSQTASQAASAGQNVARIESAVTNGAASGASTAGSAASGASSLVGKSGTSYSSARDILSAVKKGDLDASIAKKFVKTSNTNIQDGGELHSILAELANLAKK